MKSRCRWANCPNMLAEGQRYCDTHLPKAQEKYRLYSNLYDRGRKATEPEIRAFYSSREWRAFRANVLASSPICIRCKKAYANEVHHIDPVRNAWGKRLSKDNVEALCKPCHSKHEASQRSTTRLTNRMPTKE